jgi:predicted kinase
MNAAPTLVVMCGLSFAGKSTVAAGLARELNADVVSLDAINAERGLDGGQGIPVEEWSTTNDIAHERVAQLLRERMPVVVDDTGSPRFLRDEWRVVAAGTDARFALVWVRIDEAEQRRRVILNRALGERHDVTDTVLDEHVAGFEAPGTDEHPLTINATDARDPDAIADLARRVLER